MCHLLQQSSRAPLPLPPRDQAGRLAAAQLAQCSDTNVATAGALTRPPRRDVQQPASTTHFSAGGTGDGQHLWLVPPRSATAASQVVREYF